MSRDTAALPGRSAEADAVPDSVARAPAPVEGGSAALLFEPTEAGAQALIAGVAPISLAVRLGLRAAAPLGSSKPQRPCDIGLFDLAARAQLDLFQQAER